MVAWRRCPHKTSRPHNPELHARAPAFPAVVIKLRDTFGVQLVLVVDRERLGVQSPNLLLAFPFTIMDAEDFNLEEIRREIAARSPVSIKDYIPGL